MKKRHGWWLVFLLGLSFWFGGQQVAAASNPYVADDAKVLTQATKQHVKALNDNDLKALPGHPQLVVETYRELPADDMDEFKTQRFNELGIGDAKWDNGLYFVLATEAQEYGLEVGYGLEAALPDASKAKIMTDKVKADLKAERYDAAVVKITNNITKILVANKAEISTPAAVSAHHMRTQVLKAIGIGVSILFFGGFFFVLVRVSWRTKRLKKSLAKHEADLPLYASLPEEHQDDYRDKIYPPRYRRYPKDVHAWLQHDFAKYVREHFHELVKDLQPQSPLPVYAYAGIESEALPQDDLALNESENLGAYLTHIHPVAESAFTHLEASAAHFNQWLQAKKLSVYEQYEVWHQFTTGVREADGECPKDKPAHLATFKVILQGVRGKKVKQKDYQGVPTWVRDQQEEQEERWRQERAAAAASRAEEKQPFEGGSSGGGGFSGKW